MVRFKAFWDENRKAFFVSRQWSPSTDGNLWNVISYYKWSFRALRELVGTEELSEKLSFLLFGDNRDNTVAERKYYKIEEIASETITELQDRQLTEAICGDLEKHAYSVNDKIADSTVRNMNILIAVGD